MSSNLFFFSIGLLYHESQGLWYIKTLPFLVEPSLGVSYEKIGGVFIRRNKNLVVAIS